MEDMNLMDISHDRFILYGKRDFVDVIKVPTQLTELHS